jgi:hypothetical protein
MSTQRLQAIADGLTLPRGVNAHMAYVSHLGRQVRGVNEGAGVCLTVALWVWWVGGGSGWVSKCEQARASLCNRPPLPPRPCVSPASHIFDHPPSCIQVNSDRRDRARVKASTRPAHVDQLRAWSISELQDTLRRQVSGNVPSQSRNSQHKRSSTHTALTHRQVSRNDVEAGVPPA